MSFLTTFPENVYPPGDLAAPIATGAFDMPVAQACMWLAQAAYETTADGPAPAEPAKVARILRRWGFDPRAWLSRAGTEGFVAESADSLVVAFAGTDPVVAANWITDFDIRLGSGGVHRGFAQGVEHVWPDLAAALAGSGKPVVLVGHSLGGALALVAAWRLAASADGIDAGRLARVVTFGTPRAGNEAFAQACRARGLWDRTIRLHYGSDIVPAVPPAATGVLAYRHVGRVLRCPRGRRFADALPPRDEPDAPLSRSALQALVAAADGAALRDLRAAWARLADRAAPRFPAGGAATLLVETLPFFLRDHLQDCYLEALGWDFADPPALRLTIGPEEFDAFARALKSRLDERFASVSRLLRGWFPGT